MKTSTRGKPYSLVEALDARALVAGHHPDNAASRKVIERLGFFLRTGAELYEPTGLEHPTYVLKRPFDPG